MILKSRCKGTISIFITTVDQVSRKEDCQRFYARLNFHNLQKRKVLAARCKIIIEKKTTNELETIVKVLKRDRVGFVVFSRSKQLFIGTIMLFVMYSICWVNVPLCNLNVHSSIKLQKKKRNRAASFERL